VAGSLLALLIVVLLCMLGNYLISALNLTHVPTTAAPTVTTTYTGNLAFRLFDDHGVEMGLVPAGEFLMDRRMPTMVLPMTKNRSTGFTWTITISI